MAFSLKKWVNRISEYPNRRKLTHEDGSTELVTVARAEGQISAEGNAFSAEEMNDLENRIKGGFDEVNQSLTQLNEGKMNVDRITVDITVRRENNNIGDYYGVCTLDLSKYNSVISIIPISAVCKTNPGSIGILGKYVYNMSEPIYALSAPIQGTYACEFLILYR